MMRRSERHEFKGMHDGAEPLACPECGMEMNGAFHFCPGCGNSVLEASSAPSTMNTAGNKKEMEEKPGRHMNSMKTQDSFREFNKFRSRRRREEKRSGCLLLVLFLIFICFLGGGVYWFLQKAEDLPWDSAVVQKPEKGDAGRPGKIAADGEKNPGGSSSESPSHDSGKAPVADPEKAAAEGKPIPLSGANVLEIKEPTSGIILGQNVNLRESHSISTPVVGRVTVGKKVEVLSSWNSDEGAEAVTLQDLELTSPGGKKLRVPKGKGVTVLGAPDSQGMVRVTLAEDRSRSEFPVPAKSLSDPLAWPWYRIRPQGGKEGWIFGKFITVLNEKAHAIPGEYLERVLGSFGNSLEEVRDGTLGKPVKITTRKVRSSSGPGDETSMAFEGGTVVTLLASSGGTRAAGIVLASPKHPLEGGLEVGMERREVLALLGLPNDVSRNGEIYRSGPKTGIRIVYDNYRVKSISAGVID